MLGRAGLVRGGVVQDHGMMLPDSVHTQTTGISHCGPNDTHADSSSKTGGG